MGLQPLSGIFIDMARTQAERDQWKQYLLDNPMCTKCGLNPHGSNSVWCNPCRNEYQRERRKKSNGQWYKNLTEEQREKRRRRAAVYSKILYGKITRQPCDVCGDPKSEAHHYKGYAKENAYELHWLCKKHHVGLEMWEKYKLTKQDRIA